MATVPLSHDAERTEKQCLFLTPEIVEWINDNILSVFKPKDSGSFEVFIRDGEFFTVKPSKSLRFPSHLTGRRTSGVKRSK